MIILQNSIAQCVVNILISGGILLIFSSSIYLTYTIRRFFYFTLIVPLTLCPYLHISLTKTYDIPLFPSFIISILLSGLIMFVLEWGVNNFLAARKAIMFIFMLTSFALAIAAQNIFSLLWGDDVTLLSTGRFEVGNLILGARITLVQITTILAGLCVSIGMIIFLRNTKVGKSIRVLGSNPFLAECIGINATYIRLKISFISGCLAGITGILVGYDSALYPTYGMQILFLSIVGIVIGGIRSFYSVILGILLIAIIQQVSIIVIGGRWYELIIFTIFIICIITRPKGIQI